MPTHLLLIVAQAAAPVSSADSSLSYEEGNLMDGLLIAGVGLVIVYVALILISVFIATLPRVLSVIEHLWPEVDEHHVMEHVEGQSEDDLAVMAAIGFVLHSEFQRQLGGQAASKTTS